MKSGKLYQRAETIAPLSENPITNLSVSVLLIHFPLSLATLLLRINVWE